MLHKLVYRLTGENVIFELVSLEYWLNRLNYYLYFTDFAQIRPTASNISIDNLLDDVPGFCKNYFLYSYMYR